MADSSLVSQRESLRSVTSELRAQQFEALQLRNRMLQNEDADVDADSQFERDNLLKVGYYLFTFSQI